MTAWRQILAAHAETWRPYTSCYVGLVSLAGAATSGDSHALVAAWAIPTAGWLAGLYGGDYLDRDLDAIAKPQRPIPSGRMRPSTALSAMIGLIAGAALWAVLLNWHTVFIVALATAIGLSYNGFFKARGLTGNLVRGSLTSCAFLFGAVLTADHVDVRLVLLSLVFCLQDSASNLVGTLRDIDGDREGGYRTFPVVHGVSPTVHVIAGLFLGAATLAVVFAFSPLLILAIAGQVWVTARLYQNRMSLTRRYALRMHEVLCVQRLVLAASVIAHGAGTGLALPALVPAVVITVAAQRLLRTKHEFPVNQPVS